MGGLEHPKRAQNALDAPHHQAAPQRGGRETRGAQSGASRSATIT